MRFVVFLFGFIACLLTAGVACAFLFWDSFLAWAIVNVPDLKLDDSATTSMTGVSHANTGLVLLVAAGYGLLGSLFALFRCGKQGAALMLIPVLGAAFMNPYTLIFTSLQALVGFLSFFVGPLPINRPASDKDDDVIEDEADD